MKLFISYSTKDQDLAERLFVDIAGAAAHVFQYSKMAEAGKRSWTQVLIWIKASDIFIVRVSQNALSSGPVAEEIEHALWHVNSGRTKPARLISALIERNVQPPDALVATNTQRGHHHPRAVPLRLPDLHMPGRALRRQCL